jgi:adenine-specific DNA-methyltransferase
MPPRRNGPGGPVPMGSFEHDDKRVNIPTADSEELLDPELALPVPVAWQRRDKALDPQLVWKGKDEQYGEDFVVDAPPIYIQEKIVPQVIVENLRRANGQEQLDLFNDFDGLSGYEAVEYYEHEANWSNRIILGDSLQVMASLAEKENLRGRVQMIYIDPPYGIRFGSNWQVSTGKRDVSDGKVQDTTREVEQIKAFRDTWQDGINSYLAYLRDRLIAARDLLTDSGSVFVQIGDENVHLVRSLLDEVFGSENFVSQIIFSKTAGQTAQFISGTADYILWYAAKIDTLKYRHLFALRQLGGRGSEKYDQVELPDGTRVPEAAAVAGNQSGRHFRLDNITSESAGRAKGEGAASWFTVELDGRTFTPTMQTRWKTNQAGMRRLIAANRVQTTRNTLAYVRYHDDFPAFPLSNAWMDIGGIQSRADPKVYVVQTATTAIQRCLLMTTDPGDLVLDPTCGSGTTALVAEQWGRRWITIDTSRVALALARQRIMGARFPYYLLADSREGQLKEAEVTRRPQSDASTANDVRKGFVYERVPHVTLKSIANNPDIKDGMSREEIDAAIARHAETEILYDRPYQTNRKVRVAGRFTVESLSPHTTISPDSTPASERAADAIDESTFERTILDNLLKAGVQNGRKRERLEFETLTPFPGSYIQAEGIRKESGAGTPQRIGVSIGPQFGTVDPEWIRHAARESTRGMGFDLLLVCAFAFDPQAVKTTEEFAPSDPGNFATVQDERQYGKVPILLVRMNSDLAMGDVLLKKTGSANLFMVFGEPDVSIERTVDGVVVEIRGVDVYNPTTGEIRSSGTGDIALWMIDTDYDEESFFVRHCYFTGNSDPYARLKRALKADIDEAAWQSLYSTRSRPFDPPSTGKIAVKVINHYGDEVLQVYEV